MKVDHRSYRRNVCSYEKKACKENYAAECRSEVFVKKMIKSYTYTVDFSLKSIYY